MSGHEQARRKPASSLGIPATPSSPITASSVAESVRSGQSEALETQRPTPAITNPGYMGFTSFCAVYAEAENSLQSFSHVHGSTVSSLDGSPSNTRETDNRGPAFHKFRDQCLTVLRNVPDAAQVKALYYAYLSPMENWAAVVARHVLESFYSEFEPYLRSDRKNTAELEDFAHKLCVNTTRPFSDEETDPQKWIDQLCGPNLRWESLGLLFNFWGLYADPNRAQSKMVVQLLGKSWVPLARECFNLCYELCEEFSNGNSVMLHLAWLVPPSCIRCTARSSIIRCYYLVGAHEHKDEWLRVDASACP